MQDASQHYEQMKNRVSVTPLGTHHIDHRTHGIGNATREEKDHRLGAKCYPSRLCCGKNTPAHAEIAEHGKGGVLLEVNGVERNAECRYRPNHPEDGPTKRDRILS